MTKITIDIDIGEHPANLVAESIEVTLKAVAKEELLTDDADAVFSLQTTYMTSQRAKSWFGKKDIFQHGYHWTAEQLKIYGMERK